MLTRSIFILTSNIKGTLSFMHKKVKFKGSAGFMVECILSFSFHNSGIFQSNEKNKISRSKFGSPLSNTKYISEIKQKAFVLLLIKRRTFFGTPCTSEILTLLPARLVQ